MTELVGDVPPGDVGPHQRCRVEHWTQRHVGDPEWDDRGRVVVADRQHIRPGLVDRPVNGSLGVRRLLVAADLLSLQREALQVRLRGERGRQRARDQVVPRLLRMANTGVPEGIEYTLAREDPVADDELVEYGSLGQR